MVYRCRRYVNGYGSAVAPRDDLGASLHRLTRRVVERETTVLAGLGLEMWDYVVLGALAGGPVRGQASLAATTGRDKTRLIPLLDRLGEKGLVERVADPADRRHHVVRLTTAGRRTVTAATRAIREMEDEILAGVEEEDRARFLAVLRRLADGR